MKKLIIVLIILAFIFSIYLFKNITSFAISQVSSDREKNIAIPSSVFLKKVYETRENCSLEIMYVIRFLKFIPPSILAPRVKEAMKPQLNKYYVFESEFKEEEQYVLLYSKDNAKIRFEIGPEKEQTAILIKAKWPPCI